MRYAVRTRGMRRFGSRTGTSSFQPNLQKVRERCSFACTSQFCHASLKFSATCSRCRSNRECWRTSTTLASGKGSLSFGCTILRRMLKRSYIISTIQCELKFLHSISSYLMTGYVSFTDQTSRSRIFDTPTSHKRVRSC